MKKIIFTLICVLSFVFIKAQAPCAVFYTELGERFTVYIDGIAQHQYSEPNVKILDFTGLNYNVTIKFENGFIEDVNKSISLANGTESSFMIHKKQGRYDMSPKNQIPLSQASRSANTNAQQVVIFKGKTNVNVNTNTTSSNYNDGGSSNVNMSMGVTGDGGNVNMNISVSDNSNGSNGTVNTSVGVKSGSGQKDNSSGTKGGNKGNGTITSTSSSGNNSSTVGTKAGGGKGNVVVSGNTSGTTTTTSSSSGNNNSGSGITTNNSSGNTNYGNNNSLRPKPNQNQNQGRPAGYNGRIGCSNFMSNESFAQAKESVLAKNFANAQLTVAKQIADANCLLVSQIKELVKIFDFEDSKLEFAKYAYKHCCDIDNYYQVNDAFEFEGSVSKLDEYIKSIK